MRSLLSLCLLRVQYAPSGLVTLAERFSQPQVLESADRPLSRSALQLLAQFLQTFLAVSFDHLMGLLRKELEPGLSISRHPREVFINFLELGSLCTAVVRMRQVRACTTAGVLAKVPQQAALTAR